MSLEGQTAEAVLAAAFGADAVAAQNLTPAADDVNLFVDLDTGAPAPAAAAPAAAAQPSAPAENPVTEMQARLAAAERQAAYQQGLAEARAAAIAAAQPASPAQSAAPEYDPAQDALSAEEMVAYKESLPVIEKLARQAAMRVQQQMGSSLQQLQQENLALRQQMEQVSGLAHSADEKALMHTVRSAVPDADTITKTPAWKQYLDTRAPFSGGRAVRDVLEYAVKNRDAETIAEHLSAFKASHNISAPPPVAVAPGRTAAPAAVGLDVPQQRRGISNSALDEAMAKAQAGKLSKEAYDNMLAQTFSAIASGSELVR